MNHFRFFVGTPLSIKSCLIGICLLIFSSHLKASKPVGPELVPVSQTLVEGKPILLTASAEDDFILLNRLHEHETFYRPTPRASYTDDFRYFPFALNYAAKASVILDNSGGQAKTLMTAQIDAGLHYFVLSYEEIRSTLEEGEFFAIKLLVEGERDSTSFSDSISWQGKLSSSYIGEVLGNVLQHDVAIFLGRVSLRREDILIRSLDTDFSFIRSFNGHQLQDNRFRTLGVGWSFNYDITLNPINFSPLAKKHNLPLWVEQSSGAIRPLEQLPPTHGEINLLDVTNAGLFQKKQEQWEVQRSFHGFVNQEAGQEFHFLSKDHTRYNFHPFDLRVYRPTVQASLLTFELNDLVQDTSILDKPLRLHPALAFTAPKQTPLKNIVTKNDNTFEFDYQTTRFGPVLSQVSDPLARQFKFEYSPPLSKANSETDTGPSMPYRLSQVKGPDGIQLSFEYFKDSLALKRFDRGEFVEHYNYDDDPQLEAYPSSARYLSQPRFRAYTDSLGRQTRYYYHPTKKVDYLIGMAAALPLSRIVRAVRYPDMALVRFVYDEDRREVIDFLGNTAIYTLNKLGNPVKQVDAKGGITTYIWSGDIGEADALQLQVTANGRTKKFRYDSQGNITQTIYANGSIEKTLWDLKFSEPLTIEYPNGAVEKHRYDTKGNLLEYQYNDQKTSYRYNDRGQKIVEKTDNEIIEFVYGKDGYLDRTLVNGNLARSYEYDIRGRLLAQSWPNGYWLKYRYDNLDRVIHESNADGRIEETRYDTKGNIILNKVRDKAESFEVTYQYNARDLVIEATIDGKHSMYYHYDANANLLMETKANGDVTTHVYDELDEEILPKKFQPWSPRPLTF